ncbi:hypothetical protein Tco_0463452, partial [Tanacetum coccineum]
MTRVLSNCAANTSGLYRGDKAGYVCREDTDDEVDEEVSSGRLAQYGDGDGENSSEHDEGGSLDISTK